MGKIECDHILGVLDESNLYGIELIYRSNMRQYENVSKHLFTFCPNCGEKLRSKEDAIDV